MFPVRQCPMTIDKEKSNSIASSSHRFHLDLSFRYRRSLEWRCSPFDEDRNRSLMLMNMETIDVDCISVVELWKCIEKFRFEWKKHQNKAFCRYRSTDASVDATQTVAACFSLTSGMTVGDDKRIRFKSWQHLNNGWRRCRLWNIAMSFKTILTNSIFRVLIKPPTPIPEKKQKKKKIVIFRRKKNKLTREKMFLIL